MQPRPHAISQREDDYEGREERDGKAETMEATASTFAHLAFFVVTPNQADSGGIRSTRQRAPKTVVILSLRRISICWFFTAVRPQGCGARFQHATPRSTQTIGGSSQAQNDVAWMRINFGNVSLQTRPNHRVAFGCALPWRSERAIHLAPARGRMPRLHYSGSIEVTGASFTAGTAPVVVCFFPACWRSCCCENLFACWSSNACCEVV